MRDVPDEEARGWRQKFGNMFVEIGKAAARAGAVTGLHAQVTLTGSTDVLLDIVLAHDEAGRTTPIHVLHAMERYQLTEKMGTGLNTKFMFTNKGRKDLAARKFARDNQAAQAAAAMGQKKQKPIKIAERIIEPLSADMDRPDADWNF